MPPRKPRLSDGLTQEEAKIQVALLKMSKADIAFTFERFSLLMSAAYPEQMEEMVRIMARPRDDARREEQLRTAINKLIAEIGRRGDALHTSATKDVPRTVPAGRPEDV